ncbi:probable indole-3-pyruvate monooxygenase YUCCA10 [Corylus avellana]|uniref:probable indole-3-pyruvate monooxygenase YUCCA10 n=2 Tax=Corylus avellana TaxID=13451 RepID=UPI00286CCD6F|nr:probable indole-3-pyruvate monooxygenase YUCCA10 [Corylus avellana]
MEITVVIVGAGPSGLATAACLTRHSIPYVILEREDCYASLWKKRTYDRCGLHLAKEFCSLPFMPHPPKTPTFLPKDAFLHYIDDYVSHFNICPRYFRSVQSALYDKVGRKWRVEAKNSIAGKVEVYVAEFLVIASGENSEGFIPDLPGLDSYRGEIVHSNHYRSGLKYQNKDVLVVGCGNSGMEIAYDLSIFEAKPYIVVRSPFHVLTKESVARGMSLLKYLPVYVVDALVIMHANFIYGDLSKFGIHRPKIGPFTQKAITGRSPVIDVGTIKKIQGGEIQIVPEISSIKKDKVVFNDGTERKFDTIVFATGYRSSANHWLKDYKYALNDEGMPKNSFPCHWKGENGLYCAGLSKRGLYGIAMDAQAIANDVEKVLSARK